MTYAFIESFLYLYKLFILIPDIFYNLSCSYILYRNHLSEAYKFKDFNLMLKGFLKICRIVNIGKFYTTARGS